MTIDAGVLERWEQQANNDIYECDSDADANAIKSLIAEVRRLQAELRQSTIDHGIAEVNLQAVGQRLNCETSNVVGAVDHMLDENERLQTELAAAQLDAARYRWIQSVARPSYTGTSGMNPVWKIPVVYPHGPRRPILSECVDDEIKLLKTRQAVNAALGQTGEGG